VRRRPAAAALIATGVVSLAAIFTQRVISERQLRTESEAARRAEAGTRAAAATLRLNLYVSDMALALQARQDGNYTLARRIMQQQLPPPGAEDLRGFEWHWLQRATAGGEALILRGDSKPVYAVAFSPDSSLLAAAGEEGIIRLWKMPAGELAGEVPRKDRRDMDNAQHMADQIKLAPQLLRFPEAVQAALRDPEMINLIGSAASPGYRCRINSLSFSPDAQLLAAGTAKNTKVWRLNDGEMVHVIPFEHSMAAFHPRDGRLFLSSGYHKFHGRGDGRITVWKLPEMERATQDFGMSSVMPGFIRGGEVLIGGHRDDSVWQRSAADGTVISTSAISKGHRLLAAATAEDGSLGATADMRGPEVHAGRSNEARTVSLPCGRAMVTSLAISPDGQTIAAGCNDHAIRLWGTDWRERPPLRGHEAAVQRVIFSPDGRWLASGGDDQTVRVWSTAPLPESENYSGVTVRLLAHKNGMMLGHVEDGVQLWNGPRHWPLRAGQELKAGPNALRTAWPLGFSPDGSRAAVLRFVSDDDSVNHGAGALEWHRTADGTLISSLPLPDQRFFRGAVLSPDGRYLVRMGRNLPFGGGSALILIDTETGRIAGSGTADMTSIDFGMFSPDGRSIALLCEGQRLIVFDAESLAVRWKLEGAVNRCVVISSDSRTLMTAVGDQIHLIDSATGTVIRVLSGHTSAVEHLALHPDGRTLASSSADRTVRVWHLPTLRELGIVYASTTDTVACLTFTADGQNLIAGRKQKPALVW